MTKIARLKTDLLIDTKEFINILKDRDLLIYEDVQGSKIFVRYDGKKFIIRPKSLNNEDLNFIDLTVQKYYNQAFYYFSTLPDYITTLLNKSWWFCLEYFPDNQPANVQYTHMPHNGLILSCIVKGTNYCYNLEELTEYAKLFDVECLPIIFKGKLNSKQLEVIELYLSTSEKDLEYVFGEDNFAYFFYQILNPYLKNSFLMHDEQFNDNIEKIIIKIDKNSEYSFEILNPMYKRIADKNNTEYTKIYSMILINFLEFCQLLDLKKYKIERITKDELYIEYISFMFNDYIKNMFDDIIMWKFTIPDFFKEDKFKININLLHNKKTIDYIKSHEKIEYIFKVILGSFNKPKKKPIGVFDEQTVTLFNNFVEKLSKIIDERLKIMREYELQKGDLKNFNDYFNLKFNKDADEDIYPDVFTEFGEEIGGEKKKKKKGVEPIKKGKTPPMEPFTPKTEKL